MDLGLKNKVIIIIGASRLGGILKETILRNLKEEETISIILDANDENFSMSKTLHLDEDKVLFYETDISNSVSIESAIMNVFQKYKRIDVIINIFDFNSRISLETPIEVFMNSLNIENERYSFLDSNAILNSLEESDGKILNIISEVSTSENMGLYSNNTFSRLISDSEMGKFKRPIREYDFIISDKIAKNAITNLIKEKEKPEAIANMCLFLISKKNFLTGKQVSYCQGRIHFDKLNYMC